MIIDEYKIIFVHIPKTAGTTLTFSLLPVSNLYRQITAMMNLPKNVQEQYGLTFALKHAPALQIQKQIGDQKWSQYYKFAVIRNPWDRTVSAYHWIQRHNKKFKDLSFREYINFIPENSNNRNHPLYRQLRTQSSFIKSNNNIIIDELFQFEKLQECFRTLNSKFGIERKRNESYKLARNRKPYQEYYTKRMSDIIEEFYQDDIQLFDYKFEPL